MAAPLARWTLAALCQAFLASATNPHAAIGNYQPVSNVIEHSQMVFDVEAINEAARDWTTSKFIYTEGQNSCKGTSVRTLQGFVSQATADAKLNGEAFFDSFTDGTGPDAANGVIPGNGRLMLDQDFWDRFLLDALDNTGDFPALSATVRDAMREVAVKKGVLGVLTMYTTHEMESAVSKAVDGNVADGTGAPHAWDEAWAFYYGSHEEAGKYSAWEFTKKRDDDFCESADGSTVTGCVRGSDVILDYFLQGLRGSRNETLSTAEMISARNNIYRILALSSIRAALKYSYKAQEPAYDHEYHMEAYAYFLAAAGWVEQASVGAGSTVLSLLDWTKTSAQLDADLYCAVEAALVPSYQPLGLDCAMVGTYKGLSGKTCASTPACPATATLPAGLSSYSPDTDTEAGSNVDCNPAAEDDEADDAGRSGFAVLALGVPVAWLQPFLQQF